MIADIPSVVCKQNEPCDRFAVCFVCRHRVFWFAIVPIPRPAYRTQTHDLLYGMIFGRHYSGRTGIVDHLPCRYLMQHPDICLLDDGRFPFVCSILFRLWPPPQMTKLNLVASFHARACRNTCMVCITDFAVFTWTVQLACVIWISKRKSVVAMEHSAARQAPGGVKHCKTCENCENCENGLWKL